MSGPELQRELALQHCAIPIIFITALGDAGQRPFLMSQGAVDCLMKPFSEAELLKALSAALPVS
jgi:FixJ family two-component response regulator